MAHNSNLLDIPINPKHRTSYPPHKTRNKLICFPHLPDNPHKHETQPELLKAFGLQIIEENSSLFDITIYTDGSQLETGLSGSGIAIYKDKILEKISLSHPRHLSVYKSELSAIDTALKDININSPSKIIIYSDSRAAIYTLQSCFSSQEPLLKSIAKSVNRLPANSSVTVQWLPAHVGIPGNELADSLAKAGALGLPEARESTTQLDERDLLRTIKTQCLQEWKSDAAHDWYIAGGTSTGSVDKLATCEDMLEMTRTDPEWKDKIITCDETWAYGYDPETKLLSKAQRNLAATLLNFKLECIGSSQTEDEIVIEGSLKEFGRLLQLIEDERDRLLFQLERSQEAFIDPLERFRKEEIGAAKEVKDNQCGLASPPARTYASIGSDLDPTILLPTPHLNGCWSKLNAFVIKTGSTTQWQADLAPEETAFDMRNRCHESQKKFEKETVKYSQSLEQHLSHSTTKKTDNFLQEADACLEMKERHFYQISLQYVFMLQGVQEKKKFEFVETILAFMYAWLTFYHEGHEIAKDFKPIMTDLQLRLQRTRENYYATNDEAERFMKRMLENAFVIKTETLLTAPNMKYRLILYPWIRSPYRVLSAGPAEPSVVMKSNREFENRAAIIVALRAGRSPKEIVDFLKLPKTTIYRVKKQFDEADSNKEGIATRKKHSRRSDRVRGEEFVKNVKEKIDGNPGKSMRAIAKEMDVGSMTIVRTIHEDLGLKSYALRKGQLLTENMKNNRKGKAAALLNNLKHDSFGMLRFFSDEKNFDVDQKVNPRNDRWICKDPSEIPVVMHTKFPASVMVLGVISSEGDVMPPHFFEKGLRMNADTYINVLETVVKPWMDMVAAGRKYVFQQDSAPAHKAKKTQSWLTLNVPSHWGPDIWPPNSPDCNPLDYYVWGVVERDVNKAPHTTIQSVKKAVHTVMTQMDKVIVAKACASFRTRLETVVANNGN
ncbi:ARHGAP42 [Cordylochernes scorpioides]|uniref:ARHGAP42 n=1 Tax=Cordylochernes scorpioides TaxID=51811 RepID=A0ABY6K6V2_9ARAC|nr:ARHGAP42 [Cordylochernes scorpioides]